MNFHILDNYLGKNFTKYLCKITILYKYLCKTRGIIIVLKFEILQKN